MCEKWVGDRTELQHIDPHSYGHNSVSFLFFWADQPGAWGPSLSGTWFSIQHLLSNSSEALNSNCSIGSPEGPPLLGAGSLYIIFTPTDSNFRCTELYYCFTPTQSLPITGQWNLQLPPSLEWHVWSSSSGNNCHTGYPLPVHQFVTAPWDFNLVPYCQPSSPTQSLPITGERNMQLPPSLAWHIWPGRRSIYNTVRVPSMALIDV